MGRISREARLLFIQLWTLCDDEGRTRANSRMLASLLYPYDDDAQHLIKGWLDELEREDCVIRYSVDDAAYLQICKWLTHQKIDKPSRSKIPAPDGDSRTVANNRELSLLDQGSRIKDQGKDQGNSETLGTADAVPVPVRSVKSPERLPAELGVKELVALGVNHQHATDWLKARKAKRAPLTITALEDVQREAGIAGLSLAEAIRISAKKSWVGFEAKWLKSGDGRPLASRAPPPELLDQREYGQGGKL